MPTAGIEDRAKHADYQKAVERARAAGRTPPGRFRVRWRDETGSLRTLTVATRHLAMAARDDLTHGWAPMTLERLVDMWAAVPLATRHPGPPRLPNRKPLDRHVLPRHGGKLAVTITRADVERLVLALRADHNLSPSTINSVVGTLKRALEFGVRYGHLPSNPALGVRPIRQLA
ncbi:hypothetical protein [Streptacidiphilus albus]|uniref:hypothetical protein n=1 Tax=Streptacidiphilus albus TaxID=105425 RepID=UPI00128CDD1B|nr:hypothetical protein [Streptacidiphilus albus]